MKRVASFYVQVGKTYAKWAPSLVLLAVVVFVPIGLVHAITVHAEIGSLDLGNGLKVFAAALALLALTATGLIGEVFYSGAVAIALTHPHDGKPPSLREIAAMVNYSRLIAVDLIYGAIVAVGLVLLFVPGVAAFVWLGLAAPVVEIERRGVRGSFARSVSLVRGNFWVVLAVLVPIEVLGDALGGLATGLAHDLLGESLLSGWLADVLANVAFTPFYAVAAVLLTVGMIHANDGTGPAVHSEPARV
ncbi:MAG TPA: hypothetical protein VF176_02225 [Solirubrobacterales bacterium]